MGLQLDEGFVHLNIANRVVSIDLNCMSVINNAINHLAKVNKKRLTLKISLFFIYYVVEKSL